jgi:catechol 2,3-dioxygenase-like lactoylglutathione lyase family enzyme
MAFNHLALAVRDLEANHRFWTEAMGFRLVEAFDVPTGVGDGWARHVFYDTGDGTLLSLLHLHDDTVPDFDPAFSRGLGLPGWVNHLAFDAEDADALDRARDRWQDHGLDVVRIDHGRSLSIYAEDPNGNTIEWCWQHDAFTDEDAAGAAARLFGPRAVPDGPGPVLEVFAASAART